MKTKSLMIASQILFAALLMPTGAQAAIDMFLVLGDIKGESKDKGHLESIDVLAWSWGMSNSGTTQVGGGAGAGKASCQDLSLTKYVDRASPAILLHCANGAPIQEAKLFVRKAGGLTGGFEYIVITLTKVLVTSVSTGGSGGEDRLTENISLNFAKFHLDYTTQNADGSKGEVIPFDWDIVANNAK